MRISWKLKVAVGVALLLIFVSTGAAVLALRYRAHHRNIDSEATDTQEYRNGKREADVDLAQGHLRYRIYGMGETWDGPDLYVEHLRNDYGIELVRVAGCVVTEDLERLTQGYDDTMLAVIEARYGKGILQRVHEQAIEEWKQTHKSK
jgi:hypothetical protein